MTFSRLTVLERVVGKPIKWRCACVCGNVKNIRGNNLIKGLTKSCGCIVKENAVLNWKKQAVKNRKAFGYSNSRKIYSQKKRDAKGRGISFNISFDEFINISSKNCFYCDIAPLQSNSLNTRCYGLYLYNGMDRVDSSLGYSVENIVPCCWSCNKAKSSLSQSDFLMLIERIYNNRIK